MSENLAAIAIIISLSVAFLCRVIDLVLKVGGHCEAILQCYVNVTKNHSLLTFKISCMNFSLEFFFIIIILSHPVTSKQPHKIIQILMGHPVQQINSIISYFYPPTFSQISQYLFWQQKTFQKRKYFHHENINKKVCTLTLHTKTILRFQLVLVFSM